MIASLSGACEINRARGEVLPDGRTCLGDASIVNGKPEFGVTYAFSLRNAGDAGHITVDATLSTSEGEWKRQQRLQFAAGETQALRFFFHEPSLNASNIQCQVRVSPQ